MQVYKFTDNSYLYGHVFKNVEILDLVNLAIMDTDGKGDSIANFELGLRYRGIAQARLCISKGVLNGIFFFIEEKYFTFENLVLATGNNDTLNHSIQFAKTIRRTCMAFFTPTFDAYALIDSLHVEGFDTFVDLIMPSFSHRKLTPS